jgi:amino acid transporter
MILNYQKLKNKLKNIFFYQQKNYYSNYLTLSENKKRSEREFVKDDLYKIQTKIEGLIFMFILTLSLFIFSFFILDLIIFILWSFSFVLVICKIYYTYKTELHKKKDLEFYLMEMMETPEHRKKRLRKNKFKNLI